MNNWGDATIWSVINPEILASHDWDEAEHKAKWEAYHKANPLPEEPEHFGRIPVRTELCVMPGDFLICKRCGARVHHTKTSNLFPRLLTCDEAVAKKVLEE